MFDNTNKENNQSDKEVNQEKEASAEPKQFEAGKADQKIASGPDELNQSEEAVEDILSETEKDDVQPEKPAQFQPKQLVEDENVLADQGEKEVVSSWPTIKKLLIIVSLMVGLGFLSVAVFWGYKKFMGGTKSDTEAEQTEQEQSDISTESAETIKLEETEVPVVPTEEQLPDSDQDGLTDKEERALGLDINNVDSDNDGLFDREEVKVYQTDPLNQDTDSDGFSDGEEVRGGYNPKGAGKLYELN